MQNFADKIIVISGAGSGIGRCTALSFLERGAKVVSLEKDLAKSLSTPEFRKFDNKLLSIPTNVSIESEVTQAFEQIAKTFDKIDVLVNNVGCFEEKPFAELSFEDWKNSLDANLNSTFLCAKASLPLLKEQSCIVNISSNLSLIAEPEALAYCTAKAGLNMLTRCLGLYLAPRRIRVVGIAPGPIAGTGDTCIKGLKGDFSNFNPLGRYASEQEISNLILYVASDLASYITGCTINIDGGESANPVAWSILKRVKEHGSL